MEKENELPGWIRAWLWVTAIICTWDASFIMFRPDSLPGGRLSVFWAPYKYYVTVDGRYQDVEDSYVFAQSLLNYVEVILDIIVLGCHYLNSRHTRPLAFTVTVMTFWKTVLYFLMYTEFCGGSSYRTNNTALQEIIIFVIPNGVWLVVPLLVMIHLWPTKLTPTEEHGVRSNTHRVKKKS